MKAGMVDLARLSCDQTPLNLEEALKTSFSRPVLPRKFDDFQNGVIRVL